MTDYEGLPSGVLAKIAGLEGRCLTLTTQLEASRRELQRLRIERRDCVPNAVYDEEQANRESERVLSEWRRLDAAAEAQVGRCEALERRLRAEERIVRECKTFLHGLPAGARLRPVEAQGGDLDAIRSRIKATQDEIAQVGRMPVPSDDLADRVKAYVADLKARPIVSGIGAGPLSVHYPVRADANRVTLSGFSNFEGNALLLAAFLDGERLAERLMEVALDGSIAQGERDRRLRGLQEQLTRLRYDEEASVCAAIERGADVSRDGPPWAVLMIEKVEHEQRAAA